MIVWISTGILVVIILWIVKSQWQFGRRSDDFFAHTGAEIDQLRERAIDKYRAKFGKDPTGSFTLVEQLPSPKRRWFRK